MSLFDKPEKLDALAKQNWPDNWIEIDICSSSASSESDPFLDCASLLAAYGRNLKFPNMLGMTQTTRNGDSWFGSIRAAWPASMRDPDMMKDQLFTWDVQHKKYKLCRVNFGNLGNTNTAEQAIGFCAWGKESVWRRNFTATLESVQKNRK